MEVAFWRDRPTFVTGATGLLGTWLTRRLIEAGADVVCLINQVFLIGVYPGFGKEMIDYVLEPFHTLVCSQPATLTT
jgi:hypothetical protein